MTYSYQTEKSSTDVQIHAVVRFLSNLMDELTPTQQDALWEQCRSSAILWNRLVVASEAVGTTAEGTYYKCQVEWDTVATPGRGGETYINDNPVSRTIKLDKNKLFSNDGIGISAVVLAHELSHAEDDDVGANGEAAWHKEIAEKASQLALLDFKKYMVHGEAYGYYTQEVARRQIVAALPNLDDDNRPSVGLYAPDASLSGSAALEDLTTKLLGSGYSDMAAKVFFALKLNRGIEEAMKPSFLSRVAIGQDASTGVYTVRIDKPNGEPEVTHFRSDATLIKGDDDTPVLHTSANTSDNIYSRESVGTAGVEPLSSEPQPIGGVVVSVYHAPNADVSAYSPLESVTFDSTMSYGDEVWATPWDPSKVYVARAGLSKYISFGSGTYQMKFAMNPLGADVQLHESLGTSWIGLKTNADGSVRLSGAQGQHADLYGASATNLKFLDGRTQSLTGAMHGYQSAFYGGADNVDLTSDVATYFQGGAGSDTFTASESADHLIGGAGDDLLDGGSGNDILEGGEGDDALYSGDGVSTLSGGAGFDVLFTTGHDSTLDGGADEDYLYDRGTNNVLLGGLGADFLRTRGTGAVAFGGGGDDYLMNQGTGNTLYGGTGNDEIEDIGENSLFVWNKGDGSDTVWASNASSTFEFKSGTDSLVAKRQGNNLVVSSSGGGGVTFDGWFTGQSRSSVKAPDGTVWTPAQIDANFVDGVYNVSYSSGVHPATEFVSTLSSIAPSLAGVTFGPNNGVFGGGPDAGVFAAAWNSGMANASGSATTDVATGITFYSWGLSYGYGISATAEQTPGGLLNMDDYHYQVNVQYDFWDSGNGLQFALKSANWTGTRSITRMVPNPDYPDYSSTPSYFSTTHESLGSWALAGNVSRTINTVQPAVNEFTLFSPGSANSMALQSFAVADEDSAFAATSVRTQDLVLDQSFFLENDSFGDVVAQGDLDKWAVWDKAASTFGDSSTKRWSEQSGLVEPGLTVVDTSPEAMRRTHMGFSTAVSVPNDFRLLA